MKGIPNNACDCHMHVFDERYPVVPGSLPVPAGSVSQYRRVQAELGLARTVVVAPSTYGLDNRCALTALAELGSNARAVVALAPNVTRQELGVLHVAGVRGVRLNLARGASTPFDTLAPLCALIADWGWHVQLMLTPALLTTHATALSALPVPLVLDHMARIPQDGGTASPAYSALRGLVDGGNTWVKLSLASSARLLGTPKEDVLNAMGRDLVAHGTGRLVWGSDWPHVLSFQEGLAQPSDPQMLNLLLNWATSERDRREILVDTPAALYGFASAQDEALRGH
jgi:predicted TIM-barrel fold metal-dependent hydrolase